MGEGGSFLLTNGTRYIWRKSHQNVYQMESFGFPDIIQPGQVVNTYVEYKQRIGTDREDTQGNCTYALDGIDSKFHLKFRDKPSRITVTLDNIHSLNYPNDGEIPIVWRHDGVMQFVLSGSPGKFSTIDTPFDWMHQNLRSLGAKPLSKICFPGTHDAGMGLVTWSDLSTVLPDSIVEGFTRTQTYTTYEQLLCGSRYFDIRPAISGGQVWTGHYTGRLGARGESMASIIDAINKFTANNKELIIVNLSHAINTDNNFVDLNQSEWDKVLQQMMAIHDRFIYTGPMSQDISLLKLSDFIGDNRAAVVIVVEDSRANLEKFSTQGFYTPSQLNIRNEYSNTDDNVAMCLGQIEKLIKHKPGGDKRLFLLSWTLTQQMRTDDPAKMIRDIFSLKSIKDMAYSANKSLLSMLFNSVNAEAFPNVLYIDYMENKDYVALAMAINDKCFP